MSDQRKGTLVGFQKEQGFGKVDIEGVGELPFDAVVSLASPSELVPGAKVNVELGPSRIPGKLKVIKLWLEGASSVPKEPLVK